MAKWVERRGILTALFGAAAWSLAARAQQSVMPVIGFLNSTSADGFAPFLAAFRQGLKEAGIIEGRDATIEYRWAQGQYDRLPALAADLVHRKVTVMAATTTPAAVAAKAATTTIPVVFTTADDPVRLGFVVSLNRPRSNMTGVTNLLVDLGAKQLGLLSELAPSIKTIVALVNPNFVGTERQIRDFEAAARALGLQFTVLRATTESEIDSAFAGMIQLTDAGLIVGVDPFFFAHRDHLVELAARRAIPAVYSDRNYTAAGGLLSYGTAFADSYRQAGIYTGRIVRGEKPADLPVLQQTTKFELAVNLKAAKALGLAVSSSLLTRADQVIDE
ncbi:MAG TPA: ABC transporter substrate-binding protein [Xanthobacteraceae bacterium]|jgi:putative ABC transport system substrate-binding protein